MFQQIASVVSSVFLHVLLPPPHTPHTHASCPTVFELATSHMDVAHAVCATPTESPLYYILSTHSPPPPPHTNTCTNCTTPSRTILSFSSPPPLPPFRLFFSLHSAFLSILPGAPLPLHSRLPLPIPHPHTWYHPCTALETHHQQQLAFHPLHICPISSFPPLFPTTRTHAFSLSSSVHNAVTTIPSLDHHQSSYPSARLVLASPMTQ